MQLVFEQIRTGGDRNFAYVIGDRDAGQAVVIDPSYAPDDVVGRAQAQGLGVTHIVNTHGHQDHTNGNQTATKLTGAPVAAHGSAPSRPDVEIADGESLSVGALQLLCLHVPGHCDDHLVLYEKPHGILITGDLIFVGKVGGTKTEADARTEWASLQRVLQTVENRATVWPGHDYGARPSSTMAWERATNPFLSCGDADGFIRFKAEWPDYKRKHGLK